MSNYGSSEVAVLLSHLSPVGDVDDAGLPAPRTASPSEAMALYFVAARLVELQSELVARGGTQDLSAELATTREVLEGTRQALLAALARAEGRESESQIVPGPPLLTVVEGGLSERARR